MKKTINNLSKVQERKEKFVIFSKLSIQYHNRVCCPSKFTHNIQFIGSQQGRNLKILPLIQGHNNLNKGKICFCSNSVENFLKYFLELFFTIVLGGLMIQTKTSQEIFNNSSLALVSCTLNSTDRCFTI